MDKATVLQRLAEDNPAFHYVEAESVKRLGEAGFAVTAGEWNLSVSAGVLQWIADRVTPDMTTIETGAGHTTVLFAALAKHHYCCTVMPDETLRISAYMERIGIPAEKVTFLVGSSDVVLPRLQANERFGFAYIDGCHGYPFPAMDWHYIDQRLAVGGLLGMDNVELRPVADHCRFLDEDEAYRRLDVLEEGGYFVYFYEKLADEWREWIGQKYSRVPRPKPDNRLSVRMLRRVARWLKADQNLA